MRFLVSQVRPQDTQSQRFKVLECYAMMASKDKAEVEGALNRLLDMANIDPNNVPVLLAMATGESRSGLARSHTLVSQAPQTLMSILCQE